MLRIPTTICAVVLLTALTSTQAADHEPIRKYLDSKVFAVGWIDLTAVDVPELSVFFKSIGADELAPRELERIQSFREALIQLEVTRAYVFIDAENIAKGPQAAILPTAKPKATALLLESLGGPDSLATVDDGNCVLTGDAQQVAALQRVEGPPSEQLLEAIAAVDDPHGFALAVPVDLLADVMRFAQSMWKDSPADLADAALAITSTRWLTLSGQLPPTDASIRIQSASDESASQLHDFLQRFSKDRLSEDAGDLNFERTGAQLILTASNAEEASRQITSLRQLIDHRPATPNNLKRIALALHNFSDVHKTCPPQALTDASGKRLLSWRVLILPYLDQIELYQKFHLDEPWDSPHNLKLAEQIPDVYAMPRGEGTHQPPRTRVVAPLTEETAFGARGKPVWFRDILDGTSNTIWFVETASEKAVVWTKPEDLPVDTKEPFASLISPDAEGVFCAFVDGSVHYLSRKISSQTFNALLTIKGMEVIDHDELR